MLVTRGLGKPSSGLAAGGLGRWGSEGPATVYPVSIVPTGATGSPYLFVWVRNAAVHLSGWSEMTVHGHSLTVAVTRDDSSVLVHSPQRTVQIANRAATDLVVAKPAVSINRWSNLTIVIPVQNVVVAPNNADIEISQDTPALLVPAGGNTDVR